MPPRCEAPRTLLDVLYTGGRVVAGGKTFTRHDLLSLTAGYVEQLLLAGLRPGDRVVVALDHDVPGMCMMAAGSALGLEMALPYNLASARERELHALMDATQARALVDARRPVTQHRDGSISLQRNIGDPSTLRRYADAGPIERFLVLFTSGSSGAPKAVSISERTVLRRIRAVTSRLKFGESSKVLLTGLLTNTTGVIFGFGSLLNDSTLVIPNGNTPQDWVRSVVEHQITHLMLRPAAFDQFIRYADEGDFDLSTIETLAYGAAPLPADVLRHARRLVGGDLVQGYGLSETYGPFIWTTANQVDGLTAPPAGYLLGQPDETASISLRTFKDHQKGQGELCIDSDVVMNGYLSWTGQTEHCHRPEIPFRTGDIVQISDDRVWLLGRESAMVLTHDGHRFFPEEVELIAQEASGFADIAVSQLSHRGHHVAALCVSRAAPEGVAERALHGIRARLSPEKWPDAVLEVDGFRRGENEKLDRVTLRDAATRALQEGNDGAFIR